MMYHRKYVKVPMDLGTITQRVRQGYYMRVQCAKLPGCNESSAEDIEQDISHATNAFAEVIFTYFAVYFLLERFCLYQFPYRSIASCCLALNISFTVIRFSALFLIRIQGLYASCCCAFSYFIAWIIYRKL